MTALTYRPRLLLQSISTFTSSIHFQATLHNHMTSVSLKITMFEPLAYPAPAEPSCSASKAQTPVPSIERPLPPTTNQPEKQPEDNIAVRSLYVRVVEDVNEIQSKIKTNTLPGKLEVAYCKAQGMDPRICSFLHEN